MRDKVKGVFTVILSLVVIANVCIIVSLKKKTSDSKVAEINSNIYSYMPMEEKFKVGRKAYVDLKEKADYVIPSNYEFEKVINVCSYPFYTEDINFYEFMVLERSITYLSLNSVDVKNVSLYKSYTDSLVLYEIIMKVGKQYYSVFVNQDTDEIIINKGRMSIGLDEIKSRNRSE